MDPRIIDTLRENKTLVNVVLREIRDLKEDNKYIKSVLQELKKKKK